MLQHAQCFPQIGDIQILALKVIRLLLRLAIVLDWVHIYYFYNFFIYIF